RPVQLAVAGRLAHARRCKNRHPRRQICREKASHLAYSGLDHRPNTPPDTHRTEFPTASGDKPVGK
ncbi:hypothetical protein, partial [Xanthomonas vasicola]|uniref:hypothetical protein n=1 Tax=Xanthomonas vasicola TaxID=56459 RepID=UPI001C82BE38